ncbi:MAG: hypothetical protein KIT69_14700, partial [Propionibacteriaceae bacterium]|nr:hypothetical protein [Propionibacteriaceae bacterium]
MESRVLDQEIIGISRRGARDAAGPGRRPADMHGQGARQSVQLVGGHSDSAHQVKANRLLARLSALTGARPAVLNASGMASSKAETEALLRASFLQEATSAVQRLTLSLVGIGSPE